MRAESLGRILPARSEPDLCVSCWCAFQDWLEASARRGGLVRQVSRLAVLNQGQNCPPGDIWQCPETCLIVTVGERVLLACDRQRPGMPLNMLQCLWQSPQQVNQGKVSIVGRVLGDSGPYQAPTVTSHGPGRTPPKDLSSLTPPLPASCVFE